MTSWDNLETTPFRLTITPRVLCKYELNFEIMIE